MELKLQIIYREAWGFVLPQKLGPPEPKLRQLVRILSEDFEFQIRLDRNPLSLSPILVFKATPLFDYSPWIWMIGEAIRRPIESRFDCGEHGGRYWRCARTE